MPAAKKVEVEKNQNIQVALRCRPINSFEKKQGSYAVVDCCGDKREVLVKERLGVNPSSKSFSFDHVFPPGSKQIDVYQKIVTPIIDEVLLGYNCTIFAYGQTGTGKTFTMAGERSEDVSISWEEDPLCGIIPRSIYHIFESLQQQVDVEFSVRVSYLELYNEELFDLLGSSEDALRLRIYEDSTRKGSVIIQGLEEVVVRSKLEVYEILERGAARRRTAATLMNASSSRSHSVFSVTIHIKENTIDGEELLKTGKLYMVDLAGSENIGRSGAVDKRATEAGNINKSLLTLGRVITCLVEHAPHVPYRESKLTRLLQDSLGGRTKTSIIATISPASCNLDETLSTLDYAHRAKNIMNRPEVNQKMTKKALLREYTEEIERLRRDLQAVREKNGIYLAEENYISIQSQLAQQKDSIQEMEDRITAMLEEAEKMSQLFSDTKKELEETTDQLTITTDNLVKTTDTLIKTEKTLQVTEKDLHEHRYLVEEHVKTESSLYSEANELLTTAESSTTQVQALHDKLDRKRTVECHNDVCQQSFQERFDSAIKEMENEMQSFVTSQQSFQGKLCEKMASQLQTQTTGVQSLTEQLTTLQSHLDSKISAIDQRESDYNSQTQTWITDLLSTSTTTKTSELSRLKSFFKQISETIASSVQTVLQTSAEDLQQTSQLMEVQREEQKNLVQDCTLKLTLGLESLKEMVATYSTDQQQRIQSLQEVIQASQTSQQTLDKEIEEKLGEVQQMLLRKQQNYAEFTKQTSEDASHRDEKVKDFNSRVSSHIDRLSQVSTEHQNTQLTCTATHCSARQEQLGQVRGNIEGCRAACDDLLSTVRESTSNSEQVWTDWVGQLTDRMEEHRLLANTQLSEHRKETEDVKHFCTPAVSKLTQDLQNSNRALEVHVEEEKVLLSEKMDNISSTSTAVMSELQERSREVNKFIQEEIKKDIPTGLTPQRQEFSYPRILSKTDPHDVLLEKFREENPDSLVLNLAETMDGLSEQNNEPRTSTEDCSDIRDDLSDAGSDTSGISVASGCSSISKNSESKENMPRSMKPPTSRSVKKRKHTNVNYDSRIKTKLPLRSNNANTSAENY